MDDDLGVPAALAALHTVVRDGNTALAAGDTDTRARCARGRCTTMTSVLGMHPDQWRSSAPAAVRPTVDALVQVALEQRAAARARKDYAASDAIRDQLAAAGVAIEDTPDGPRWSLEGSLMAGNSQRQGAIRKSKKGPQVGSGGQPKRALKGKGPTPPAEARKGHPAARRAAAAERRKSNDPKQRRDNPQAELLVGRNPVAEALRAKVPATALYVAHGLEADERVTEAVRIAGNRGIALLEVSRAELDRRTGNILHQGIALQVPPFAYHALPDLLREARRGRGAAAARRARRRHRPAQPRRGHPLRAGLRRARRDHSRAALGRRHRDGLAHVGRARRRGCRSRR